ncbi:3-ketoacyl-ACP reductase [Aerococcus urinaehominis]|uniref:3-ketoacyl-ACP reductase n=1 Tax=Aerococcus urinaehominis TaxID=128944 RepID=A0A0X8FJS8_9LACT|nr:SDR family oxidoreductase [Aerococcus urinaehominis]AMB98580.1 3-ketoacyl-ACP reductase [Aerococcus urinaehominis]SDL77181.1 3-oxoacyl-[acyl-carrier protein] reductase [Aerococcus urinaehominis]
MFDLSGQVAVVTGGANGIGAGVVQCLAQAGAYVAILDIDQDNGQRIAAQVEGDFYQLDVTDHEATYEVFKMIAENQGKIDILVANTGVYPEVMLADVSETDYYHTTDINLKGMIYATQAAVHYMKEQHFGRIILMSSITGDIAGYPGGGIYGATKAAALGFMRNIAVEYGQYGITVNAIQPGLIATESLKALGAVQGGEKYIPMQTLGQPSDIGAAAVFFASKEAAYVTGQALVVDGGQILPETPNSLPD